MSYSIFNLYCFSLNVEYCFDGCELHSGVIRNSIPIWFLSRNLHTIVGLFRFLQLVWSNEAQSLLGLSWRPSIQFLQMSVLFLQLIFVCSTQSSGQPVPFIDFFRYGIDLNLKNVLFYFYLYTLIFNTLFTGLYNLLSYFHIVFFPNLSNRFVFMKTIIGQVQVNRKELWPFNQEKLKDFSKIAKMQNTLFSLIHIEGRTSITI